MTLGTFNNVSMTETELDRLYDKFGKLDAEERIETLSEYLASKNKRYKSHVAVILNWARRDAARKDAKKQTLPALARPELAPHMTTHLCTCCALDHKWDCTDDPLCTLPYEIPCRSFINSRLTRCTP